jgi:hypothetical protein
MPHWELVVRPFFVEIRQHLRRYYPDEGDLLEILGSDPVGFAELVEDSPALVQHLLSLGLVNRSEGDQYVPAPLGTLLT